MERAKTNVCNKFQNDFQSLFRCYDVNFVPRRIKHIEIFRKWETFARKILLKRFLFNITLSGIVLSCTYIVFYYLYINKIDIKHISIYIINCTFALNADILSIFPLCSTFMSNILTFILCPHYSFVITIFCFVTSPTYSSERVIATVLRISQTGKLPTQRQTEVKISEFTHLMAQVWDSIKPASFPNVIPIS